MNEQTKVLVGVITEPVPDLKAAVNPFTVFAVTSTILASSLNSPSETTE